MFKDKLDREIMVGDVLLVAFASGSSSAYLERRRVLEFKNDKIKVINLDRPSWFNREPSPGYLNSSKHSIIIERDGKALV